MFVLRDHPARLDVHGVKVPAFPEMREILCNGSRIAYCGAPGTRNYGLTFIRHYPDTFVQDVLDWLKTQDVIPTKHSRPVDPVILERAMESDEEDIDSETEGSADDEETDLEA